MHSRHSSINDVEIALSSNPPEVKVIAYDGRSGDIMDLSFTICEMVAAGSHGDIFRAQLRSAMGVRDVAIKRILRDKRSKNKELETLKRLEHPNTVQITAFFYSTAEKNTHVYLNLVFEYMPDTVDRANRYYAKQKGSMPMLQVKLFMYQLFRSLAYTHSSGVCHRDVNSRHLLIDPPTGLLQLCDFGSAQVLGAEEPDFALVGMRSHRAPELLYEAKQYTRQVDLWSAGCVMAELIRGKPLFEAENDVDHIIEIIRLLGTPSKEDIDSMNPEYALKEFPEIKPRPLSKVLRPRVESDATDLMSKLLQYKPESRLTAFEALCHPFFDELRTEGNWLPNGRAFPPLFNFTVEELAIRPDLVWKLMPKKREPEYNTTYHVRSQHPMQNQPPPPKGIAGWLLRCCGGSAHDTADA